MGSLTCLTDPAALIAADTSTVINSECDWLRRGNIRAIPNKLRGAGCRIGRAGGGTAAGPAGCGLAAANSCQQDSSEMVKLDEDASAAF